MCRLLGVVFRGEFPAETLSELRTLSEIGRVPGEERRGHRDGWGIATFQSGNPYYIARRVDPAFSDMSYNDAIDQAKRITSPNILIAHVRAASSGAVSVENTHPFIVNGLIFAHNGTVKDLPPDQRHRQKGQTDSELIALMVADRMAEKRSLPSAVESVIRDEIDRRKFSAAVMLATDGKVLVGYRDYEAEDRSAYYGLKIARCAESVALFQELAAGCAGEQTEIGSRDLVTVTQDMNVTVKRL